jgi:hypothetical protein
MVGEVKIYAYNEVTGRWESVNVSDIVPQAEDAEQTDVLRYPETLKVTVEAYTSTGTAKINGWDAPSGKVARIRYLKLTTPEEVSGNILVTTKDSTDKPLLAIDQEPNTTRTYDVVAIWGAPIRVTSIKVRGTATTTTTADRDVVLEFTGTLVTKRY